MPAFKDHFSRASSDYRQFRPRYPDALFSYLAAICAGQQLAWDCATGSGQSATRLSGQFSSVIATDASAKQIQSAVQVDGISYRVASAENSGIDAKSVDLITVAQALHWFDIEAFAKEVDRVLKTGGILAVWTYNLLSVDADIDARIHELYHSVLGTYWPEERKMVENGYANIGFSFDELEVPCFHMTEEWGLPQLLGYLRTWSALKRYHERRGVDPVVDFEADLSGLWGGSAVTRVINWPLSLRIWRKS